MNLDVSHGHVDVGGKDRDEEQSEAPSGQELDRARGNEQRDAAEQFKNAAKENAAKGKGNPRRHDRKEELRIAQMEGSGEKEERGKKEPNEGAENQDKKRWHGRA